MEGGLRRSRRIIGEPPSPQDQAAEDGQNRGRKRKSKAPLEPEARASPIRSGCSRELAGIKRPRSSASTEASSGCMEGPKVKEAKKMGRPKKESFDKPYPHFKHRCVPGIVGNLNESLSPGMQDEVKKSPFASALGIKVKKESIPENFASYLVHRVNTETGELELGENREVKIKLANVIEMVTGLKNEGEEVPIGKLLSGKNTSKPFRQKTHISDRTADGRSRGPHAKIFQNRLKEAEKELTCSTYAAIVLCCILCSNSSQNVDARFLKCVSSLDEMNKYNWFDFVLRYLIQAIKNLKKGILHSLYGNMLMLVAIFLDMAVGRDMPRGFPRTSVIVDADLKWLRRHHGTWDKLKLRKFSESIYGDKYVENKEGETSRSKEDGDVSQMDCEMRDVDQLSKIIKSAEEGSDISAEEKLNTVIRELKLLQNQAPVQERGKHKRHPSVTVDDSQPMRKSAPNFKYPANDDRIVLTLLCRDLRGLAPKAWFTSTLIELYSHHLNRLLPLKAIENGLMKELYHVCNPYLYTKIESYIDKRDMVELERMGEWFWEHITDEIYIFIPVHTDKNHFSLAVIYRPHKDFKVVTALHLDSISSLRSEVVLQNIERFSRVALKVDVINSLTPKVPQQKNDYDCGVDTLYNIQRMITMGAPDDLKDLKNKLSKSFYERKEINGLREYIKSLVLDNKLMFIEGGGRCECKARKDHATLMSKWSDAFHNYRPENVPRTSSRLKQGCTPLSPPPPGSGVALVGKPLISGVPFFLLVACGPHATNITPLIIGYQWRVARTPLIS